MWTNGAVTSSDGATVGYRRLGAGEPVILVHGELQSSYGLKNLARVLEARFVYVPDRRGRRTLEWIDGAYALALEREPPDERYGLAREREDLAALLRETGARRVFGIGSGALIALDAALHLDAIDRLALYEPPLAIDGSDPGHWVPGYEAALSRGQFGRAMAEFVTDATDRRWRRLVLRARCESHLATDSRGILRAGVEALQYDAVLVRESPALIPRLGELRASVLLMGGRRTTPTHRQSLDALHRRLPAAHRVMLHEHGPPMSDSQWTEEIGGHLRAFFA